MGLTYEIEGVKQRQAARDAARDNTRTLARAGAPSLEPTQASFISFPSYSGTWASTPHTNSQPAIRHPYGADPFTRTQMTLNPPLLFLTDAPPPLESESSGLADSGNGLVYNARGIVAAHLFFPLIVQVVPNAPGESYLFEDMSDDYVWQAQYGWDDADGPLPQEGDIAVGWWADRGKLRKGEGRVVTVYREVKAVWVEEFAEE
ncbi:hypothetical protein BDW71DRAFT_212810 [Aspergillus fruticulosus]